MPAVISDPPRERTVASGHLPEQWWRSFFESSEDAQIVCRSDGLAVKINPKAARLLKVDRAAAEGDFSVFDVLLPPADQKLRESLQRGCIRPDALHSVALLAGGRQTGMADLELAPLDEHHTLVTFKDIARRMRLESHVNRLVTAIDATPDVFFLTDADGRITFVNPAFHNVTGYDIEAVLDRTDEFLRAPSEAEKVSAYLEHVSQGREWIGELTNLRRDGTSYQVEATVSPISDMTGRFIGYVACERDITTRKKLEGDLRLQHDFVRSILHSLDGAIYSLDREFRVTHANDGWRRLPAEHGGIRLDGPPEIGRAAAGLRRPTRAPRRSWRRFSRKCCRPARRRTTVIKRPTDTTGWSKFRRGFTPATCAASSATSPTRPGTTNCRASCSSRRKWKSSARSPPASPTISTTCSRPSAATPASSSCSRRRTRTCIIGASKSISPPRAPRKSPSNCSPSAAGRRKSGSCWTSIRSSSEAVQLARRTLRANVNLEIVPAPNPFR